MEGDHKAAEKTFSLDMDEEETFILDEKTQACSSPHFMDNSVRRKPFMNEEAEKIPAHMQTLLQRKTPDTESEGKSSSTASYFYGEPIFESPEKTALRGWNF